LNVDGTWFSTVTPVARSSSRNADADAAVSSGTTTRRPPWRSAPHISQTEKSNEKEWNSYQMSLSPKSKSGSVAAKRARTFACVTQTPFGAPLDPEV
jgi:hypothetical protein